MPPGPGGPEEGCHEDSVSVPGLTHEYRKIRYRIFVREEEGPEVVEARMPAQALAEALGVDHVLLLIPDSLGNGESYDEIINDAAKNPFNPFGAAVHPSTLLCFLPVIPAVWSAISGISIAQGFWLLAGCFPGI